MGITIDRNEITKLSALSSTLGRDPLQVQAAGGNTSVKLGDTMWIKASGTQLAEAVDRNLFVPVQLTPLRQALSQNDPRAEKSIEFVEQDDNPNGLRPSIETTVHAVLPQKVVLHVHCVDTIALAIQKQAQTHFEHLLARYQWLWVPYLRPGLPLSKYIASTITPGVNVIILGNHGLVVAADSIAHAEALLKEVRAALKQPITNTPEPDMRALATYADLSDYRPASDNITHAVALNKATTSIAAGGSLYPDHVIFLGDGSTLADPAIPINTGVENQRSENKQRPASIIVPGAGVLVHKDANDSQLALVRCLSDVCIRVTPHAAINYLTADEVHALLHWEAETYRQSLASAHP